MTTSLLSSLKEISILDTKSLKSKFDMLSLYRWLHKVEGTDGSFYEFARSYEHYGVYITEDGDIGYKEWAPNAKQVSLVNLHFDDMMIVWRLQ